ncbi:DUF3857 domain-containing protein [Lewinella sp. JB7]|uniref:DUF3857 domain-containing protein n=1 Tax=Lewinella sp. JB7 TaxID=2962887 RepID=UPI0020C97A1D|nr:DUF3857 domain-containing protein [Lewinella sp. JB7]MCP9237599.1 DUF3857 domain-containing protein [Lewinella sp. JB7]
MYLRIGQLLFALLFTCTVSGQPEKIKFGRISDEDRQLLSAPGDSAAAAYVLYDGLHLTFEYLQGKGPVRVERFHRRLKLLKPSSFDRADIILPYNRDYQDITGVDAVVHLPEGGTVKLSKRDIITEKRADNREAIKFTFPQVSPGATIEYEYTLRSESILVPTTYQFQEDIPVRWAEYTARIPVYYKYVSLGNQGQYAINDVSMVRLAWNGPRFSVPGAYSSGNANVIEQSSIHWAMADIPAFEDQPYTNNFSDYLPKVRLQLQSVQYPNQMITKIFSDWTTTVKDLHARRDFGKYYQRKGNYGKLWKEAEAVVMAGATDREKIDAAYYFICRRLKWNGHYGILASESPNDVFEGGGGNSADLNIALLALLNEAGIEAQPLLVSLRDGGAPIEIYPLITQFDHLMVYTEVDGQPYLLDANGPDRPPGLPRVNALNHRGWIADELNPRWVDVNVPSARRTVMADLSLGADGYAEVSLQSRMDSYFGFDARSCLDEMESGNDAPLAEEIRTVFPEAEIVSHEVLKGGDNSSEPLAYRMKVRIPAAMPSEDYLYVQPILLPALDSELDDVETRLYPIDFPYPQRLQYISNIRLPEGYAVEELPQSVNLVSEDGGMSAKYVVESKPGQMISLIFEVELDRTLYSAAEYPVLREMFRRVIEIQESAIVLKRAK